MGFILQRRKDPCKLYITREKIVLVLVITWNCSGPVKEYSAEYHWSPLLPSTENTTLLPDAEFL